MALVALNMVWFVIPVLFALHVVVEFQTKGILVWLINYWSTTRTNVVLGNNLNKTSNMQQDYLCKVLSHQSCHFVLEKCDLELHHVEFH